MSPADRKLMKVRIARKQPKTDAEWGRHLFRHGYVHVHWRRWTDGGWRYFMRKVTKKQLLAIWSGKDKYPDD